MTSRRRSSTTMRRGKLVAIRQNNDAGPLLRSFSYDRAGRTVSSHVPGVGTTSYSWDFDDRLRMITYPNSSTNTFSYNGFGARVTKTDSSGSRTYLRAGTSVVAPVVDDGGAVYTPGISERRGGASRFYHADIKNNLQQTNASQGVDATKQYDAFGNAVGSSGTWNGQFAYGGAYGYQTDADSGFMLLGHRYYEGSTGRFLSRDPVANGRYWVTYCGNNPCQKVDPSGLTPLGGWVAATFWFLGEPRIDPEGYPVWVGGFPAVFLRKRWALTFMQVTFLNDKEDWGDYVNDTRWRAHEHRHVLQEQLAGTGAYIYLNVEGYVLTQSHDDAPMEIDAQNAAGSPYRDPFEPLRRKLKRYADRTFVPPIGLQPDEIDIW